MDKSNLKTNLVGEFLIASPSMNDPHFYQTVTYICENNEAGSLGFIINRPMEADLSDILNQLDLEHSQALANFPILQGGPVGLERGFVLHQEGKWDNTSEIINGLSVTTSKDILKSISSGLGPSESLLILGYSGWGPGQLEQELTTSSWINTPANNEILFTVPYENRWKKAINLLGIEASDISDQIGHA